jgi:hypothetical protein
VSRHVRPVPSTGQLQSVWVSHVSSRIEKNTKIQRHNCRFRFQSLDFIKEVGRRIAAVNHEPRSTVFLRQRLSVAVQRGNAYCVLGTFRGVSNVDRLMRSAFADIACSCMRVLMFV